MDKIGGAARGCRGARSAGLLSVLMSHYLEVSRNRRGSANSGGKHQRTRLIEAAKTGHSSAEVEAPSVSMLHISLNLRSYLRWRRVADRRRCRGTARRLMVRLHALLLGGLLARVCFPKSRRRRRRVIFGRRCWCGLLRRRERGSSWAAHWTAIWYVLMEANATASCPPLHLSQLAGPHVFAGVVHLGSMTHPRSRSWWAAKHWTAI